MKSKIIILLFAFISISSAQNKSYAFPIVSLGTFYTGVPTFGTSHFLREDYSTGSIFAATEATSFYFANKIIDAKWDTTKFPNISNGSTNYNIRSHGWSQEDYSDRYLNQVAKNFTIQLNNIDLFLSFRQYWAEEIHNQSLSQSNFFNLASAPFQTKYLKEPEVFLPIAIAIGYSLLSESQERSLFDTKTINLFGRDYSALEGGSLKILSDFVIMSMVALSEEMLFRGMIQTSLSESVNPNFGLVASSILFGLAHLPSTNLIYSLRAMAAGFYFGWQYQKYNNDIGRTIALHFQIDFMPTLISLFKSPSQSSGVYKVGY
jgi:membrane protease YdiL (CAAX protease family)